MLTSKLYKHSLSFALKTYGYRLICLHKITFSKFSYKLFLSTKRYCFFPVYCFSTTEFIPQPSAFLQVKISWYALLHISCLCGGSYPTGPYPILSQPCRTHLSFTLPNLKQNKNGKQLSPPPPPFIINFNIREESGFLSQL